MTTCLLIHNPVSRSSLRAQRIDEVLAIARAAGWEIALAATERAGHATELARDAAARGIDVVVVNGGDGTINEAVNGLAGTDCALAVLPGGTANVWAKEIRMPRDARKAMRAIVGGARRRVDLGRADGRYFLLMAGIGLDAAIVPRVSEGMKRRLGALAYIVAGVPVLLRTKTRVVRVAFDREERETPLYWLLAGNTRSYGGVVNVTHRAEADDGLLDVVLMRRGGIWRVIVDGVRLLFRRHDRSPNVSYVRVRALEVRAAGLPVQVDGEAMGETPMRFEAAPGALAVIVPAGLRTPLLRDAEQPR